MKKKLIHYKAALTMMLLLSINFTSCKKFIEVDPPATSVNEGNVYEYDGTAISAVINIYSSMSNSNFAGNLTFYPELSADNLTLLNITSVDQFPYYQNELLASDGFSVPKPWIMIYPLIFNVNAAIEGLSKSKSVSPTVKEHLIGQVYFLRAFYYFYLTNFYGDVPLALSTDYTINNSLRKTPSAQIYSQIVTDLKQAQNLLPESYLKGDMINTFTAGEEQRVTPNRAAATALLARVYLYQKDWANAESAASEVIGNSSIYTTAIPLNEVFLKNSRETIWALQPVITGANANEADMFTLLEGQPTPNSAISAFLTDEFIDNFQVGDQRRTAWIDTRVTDNIPYPYPAKYKALSFTGAATEQSVFLRLSEQYLIRAEARIQQNNLIDGITDLNTVRDRAIDKTETDESKRLKPLSASLSKEEALAALSYERRVELFAECAHRWFDLKRTGQVDAVMTPATAHKGGTWSKHKSLYPIPADELRANINLVQNDGYTN